MKNKILTGVFICIFGVMSAMCYFKSDTEFSYGERRVLAQSPEVSAENIMSGEYTDEFELYAADQIPFRENLRSVKAVFSRWILNKADDNGLYLKEGHLSKIEYPENEKMMEHAVNRFAFIYDEFLKDSGSEVYLSIIPDKNYFLANKYGYPSMDYEKFINYFKDKMDYAEYINIAQHLEIDDYYKTDSHWKQEEITGIAKYMAGKMNAEDIDVKYTVKRVEKPFYGVYAGQSALMVDPEELKYLTNDVIEKAVVTYYDTGLPKKGEMYNLKKAEGKDPYEIFLSGPTPIVTIENPDMTQGGELIIFRDSFGSSIAPLLSQRYKKTTVVDIRYVQSDFLGNLIDFNGQDVLFLYSTTMLNTGNVLR